MDIDSVSSNIAGRPGFQPDIAVNPRAGIPSAVGALMHYLHNDFIAAIGKCSGHFMLKGGIPVFPFPYKTAVHIDGGIHVYSVKRKPQPGSLQFFLGAYQGLAVPADAVLIEIEGIVNQPVMGQIHSRKG
ncbi:hypothetical protein D3C75_686630 [compost metagenome]